METTIKGLFNRALSMDMAYTNMLTVTSLRESGIRTLKAWE
jgi:hypothetical protein